MPEREELSLYREVTARGYEACVIATYCVSFPFYERVILRRLQSSGCRHNILLADARQVARQVNDPEARPELCGHDYTLIPVKTSGAFHPKFILLLGRKKCRLILGSHNMTVGGFGLNREVATAIDLDGDGPTAALGSGIWKFVRAWTSELPGGLTEVLRATERIAPWLANTNREQVNPALLYTAPGTEPLWQQLKPRMKGLERVFVVSPFFDSGLSFLKTLADLSPKECVVAIHPQFSEIPADNIRSLGKAFRFVDVSRLGADWMDSKLHAKLYRFELNNGTVLVLTGSPNASGAAWLRQSSMNAELAVLHEQGEQVWRRLGLQKLGALPKVDGAGWDKIRARAQERKLETDKSASEELFLATTTPDGFLVSRRFVPGKRHNINVYTDEGLKGGIERTIAAGAEMLCTFSDVVTREAATRLETVVGKGSTRVALVHHVQALMDKAAGRLRNAFRRALSGLEGDADQLLELIQIVEKAIFDEDMVLEQERSNPASKRGKTVEPQEAQEVEPTSMAISARETTYGRKRRLSPTSDLSAIIDALIYRLGRGLKADSDGAQSVKPSDEDLRTTENEPTREIDGAALAKMCRSKINRLFRRMVAQLKLVANGKGDATSRIIQLAAVLAVIRHLQARQSSFDWLPKGEVLVDCAAEGDFFREMSRLLYAPGYHLAASALSEQDGKELSELSTVRALVPWLACDCGIDARDALTAALKDPDETREELIDLSYLLPAITDCAADEYAADVLSAVAKDDRFLREPLSFHLAWGKRLRRAITTADLNPSRINLGDVVIPSKVKGAPAIVVELHSDKAGLLDLNTGNIKYYKFGFLSTVQPLPRGKAEHASS